MINCPITKASIDEAECTVTVDVCDGCVKDTILSDRVKKVENWKDICINCKYHNQDCDIEDSK